MTEFDRAVARVSEGFCPVTTHGAFLREPGGSPAFCLPCGVQWSVPPPPSEDGLVCWDDFEGERATEVVLRDGFDGDEHLREVARRVEDRMGIGSPPSDW